MGDAVAVVCDSGPLIVLAAVGRLHLLHQSYGNIVVPEAVYREVTSAGEDRPGAREVAAAPWIHRVVVAPPPEPLLRNELGRGEAEAIALCARTRGALLVADDLKARRIATLAYGLRVIGTVGVLVAAKRAGLLAAVAPILAEARAAGFRVSDSVVVRALREASEQSSGSD
jgi:predicted nucleic acid-binding protein